MTTLVDVRNEVKIPVTNFGTVSLHVDENVPLAALDKVGAAALDKVGAVSGILDNLENCGWHKG
jgi:hypothetical protein